VVSVSWGGLVERKFVRVGHVEFGFAFAVFAGRYRYEIGGVFTTGSIHPIELPGMVGELFLMNVSGVLVSADKDIDDGALLLFVDSLGLGSPFYAGAEF